MTSSGLYLGAGCTGVGSLEVETTEDGNHSVRLSINAGRAGAERFHDISIDRESLHFGGYRLAGVGASLGRRWDS